MSFQVPASLYDSKADYCSCNDDIAGVDERSILSCLFFLSRNDFVNRMQRRSSGGHFSAVFVNSFLSTFLAERERSWKWKNRKNNEQ